MSLYVYRCPQCAAVILLADRHVTQLPMCQSDAHDNSGSRVAMELLRDNAQALLPISGAPTIGPLKVDTLKSAGILVPETQHALEWLYRHRATNGMAGAFLMIGGRRCIDLVAFARLMREQRA